MTKTRQAKFEGVKGGTPDRSRRSARIPKQVWEKQVQKTVKNVGSKVERPSSSGSLVPTRSLSTLSVSMDSEDSAMTSGLNTPTPTHVAPSPRKNSFKMARSADSKKPGMSQISMNSSIVPGKWVIKKLGTFEVEPSRIYKIKKDQTNYSAQVITGPTQSDDSEDEYLSTNATSEEDENAQSEGERTDSEDAITSMRDSQMSVSSDSNIRMRLNLLQNIRHIPNWDELSSTSTIGKIKTRKEDNKDLGRFRDPLASNSSISLADSIQQTEPDYEEVLPPDDPDGQSPPSLSASELESDDDSEWELERTGLKSSVIPTFTEFSSGSWSSQTSTHVRSHVTFPIDQIVQSYLNGLIEKVVHKFENPVYVLSKSLDKSKLLDRLLKEVDDNTWERYENELLTKRLTEHHLRRFKYSLVTPSKGFSINEAHQRRYMGALYELDLWLQREREAEEIFVAERDSLLGKLEQLQAEDSERVEEMEQIIRKTIFCQPQTSDRLKFVTETALRQMRKKRDLMSETRLALIIKQHNNAYIKQKIDETETISGEVKLDTYLSTETDVQQLTNTLTNRNAELHRMYALIKSKIHTTSHLRCCRKLLSRKFRVAKAELRKKQQQHLALRDHLYTCNLKHNKLLAKINEVRQKAGIMCYPKLLADFDLTVNLILVKRDRVQELKEQHDDLLRKIDKLESTLRTSTGSSD
ncbi:uncharacterized protein LOC108033247 [Drosophila biarmipes]|uniref:uncharacterized protein LOC108033247 n=1 Tax=Drosophila biarmipes TaxID=125945 RepID=UPI0007E89228|nr:uncharacterized protein LOC108033247 [Drosophila biarmipes]